MQVEALTVALRKRSNWEAIDLGFSLARRWFLKLWCAWMIGAFPIFILVMTITIFLNENTIGTLAIILFWWLKPLYEQPLLYILSRQIFSEKISLKFVFKNYFKIIKSQLLALLLWRRFSLSRSFNNPVAMLEGLNGKERKERLNVLHARQNSARQWLTVICINLEILLNFSFMIFIYMLLPSELHNVTLFELLDTENLTITAIENITYFIAVSIIAPVYVAAGFALYITRRIKLEGWDIELAFKQIQNRISSIPPTNNQQSIPSFTGVIAGICLLITLIVPSTNYATSENEISKEYAKTTIEEVFQNKHFGKTTKQKKWIYIGEEQEEKDFPKWLEKFLKWLLGDNFDSNSSGLKLFEILIWLAVGTLVIWLIKRYSHWMRWINTQPTSKNKSHNYIPKKIMGIEISKESLPKDVYAEFTALIQKQHYRPALSLLYRATLSLIVHSNDFEIPASATEQECNLLVKNNRNEREAQFFTQLTRAWILLAYGNQLPNLETLLKLRDQWRLHFGEPA